MVDHKTGKIPEPRPGHGGHGRESAAGAVWLAAEKILGEAGGFGRLYYSTIAQNYTAVDVTLHQWTRRRAEQVLETIDERPARRLSPAAPRKDGCKHCEYLAVCGPYEEERVQEKSQAELKGLKELRTWR